MIGPSIEEIIENMNKPGVVKLSYNERDRETDWPDSFTIKGGDYEKTIIIGSDDRDVRSKLEGIYLAIEYYKRMNENRPEEVDIEKIEDYIKLSNNTGDLILNKVGAGFLKYDYIQKAGDLLYGLALGFNAIKYKLLKDTQ